LDELLDTIRSLIHAKTAVVKTNPFLPPTTSTADCGQLRR
jgi:hypothetical protein